MDLTIVAAIVVFTATVGLIAFVVLKGRKSDKEESLSDIAYEKKRVTADELYEMSLSGHLEARLKGVSQRTDIDQVFDAAREVIRELEELDEAEYQVLVSLPEELERMFKVHLKEMVRTQARVNEPTEESLKGFNEAVSEMVRKLSEKAALLESRNVSGADEEMEFLAHRYSNKY